MNFVQRWFLLPDGSKRRPCYGHGPVTVRWEGLDSFPEITVTPQNDADHALAVELAEFVGMAPVLLQNAREDRDAAVRELAKFKGQVWRGEAVAIEDDNGGVRLHGAGILDFPYEQWSSHLCFWYRSWDELAEKLALSPSGVGMVEGRAYVKLKPYPKPKG